MKLNLFKQNPQVEKYKPDSATRQIESMSLDRKEDLERFRAWMEGTAKEKSDLPDQKELDELNKQTESGKGMSLGLLGVIAAIPIAGIALGGGFGSLTKIANDAMSAITGGGDKPGVGTGSNNNILGLDTKDTKGSRENASTKLGKEASKGLSASINPTAALDTLSTGDSAPKSTAAPIGTAAAATTVNTGGEQPQRPPLIPNPLSGFTKGLEEGSLLGGVGSEFQKKLSDLFKGKNPLEGFLNKVFGSKEGRNEIGKIITKFVRKIPFLGTVIGTLLDVFIFGKENKKSEVKKESINIGEAMFGGLVGWLGYAGNIIKNLPVGNWFGGWLFGNIFSGGPVVPKASNESIKESIQSILGLGKKNNNNQTNPPAPEPAGQPLKSRSTDTTENSVSTGTGNVNQWLHGNPNLPGYDRYHAGQKYGHDHFSFNSRESAVKAYKALKAAGYTITEFEGYGKYTTRGMRPGSHSAGGGHFGPVGGAPTYNDLSDGTAFDIPWSSYGSGPIGQKDYDLSLRAAQIVGAVDASGANIIGKAPQSEPSSGGSGAPPNYPDYGQGRTAPAQPQQQANMFENMMEPFRVMADIFKTLNDKEYMDSLVLNDDGTVTTKKKKDEAQRLESQSQPELFPGMQSILDTIEPTRTPKEVSMLSPEAEAAQENVLIISGDQHMIQTGEQERPTSDMMSSQAPPSSNGAILIGAGSNPRELHKLLMSTKIG